MAAADRPEGDSQDGKRDAWRLPGAGGLPRTTISQQKENNSKWMWALTIGLTTTIPDNEKTDIIFGVILFVLSFVVPIIVGLFLIKYLIKNINKKPREKNTKTLFAVCVLIAFILLIPVMSWLSFGSVHSNNKSAPDATIELEDHPDYYVAIFLDIKPSVSVNSIELYLQNHPYTYTIMTGCIGDYFSMNPTYKTENGDSVGAFSYYDSESEKFSNEFAGFSTLTNDDAGLISPGSRFFIPKEILPANLSLRLYFIFYPSSDIIGNILYFDNAIWNATPIDFPEPLVNITQQTGNNFSFEPLSLLSHYSLFSSRSEMESTAFINNTGNQSYSNITFNLLLENEVLASRSGLEIPAGNVSAFTLKPDEWPVFGHSIKQQKITLRFLSSDNETLLEAEFDIPVIRYRYTTFSLHLPIPLLFLSLLAAAAAQTRLRSRAPEAAA